ncbi:carotenoid 1,2-hydratase [Variovorax sp. J2P1-59]|uniref:lipocalin-like domain-containing protein n=1 Tax=Variovorax flavidus TaxID=3053501 RepID=UPI0025752C92|nr:carotenoid 1,2-hydratase [Variovorax sp. J2P1-59]MDM0076382.1 carotenoid 1,2-hydratase [Variovorax sp. J2P1-59]
MRALGLSRRALLLSAFAVPAAWALPPRAMQFPRDFGSHPDLRTEWWYITGHAKSGARDFGFQLTFFRSRVEATQSMRSAFAARQLIFAHAAITDLEGRKLWHDQRIAREGFGVAFASETDTDVRLRDWTLQRDSEGYAARLPANGFAIDLRFSPTQPVMLQGSAGLSRKGPDAEQASYYFSEPQLAAKGSLSLQGKRFDVQGSAWLDREWSEAYLHPGAAGWDWIGMNLFDGSALMAFRIRGRDGSALWAGGSHRTADGRQRVFGPDEVHFDPDGTWTSPRTRAVYPTRWRIQTPAGAFAVRALLDDQELDSQGSTGTVYWEGLSDLLDASGKPVGRGYLELTGYAQPLRL